MLPEPLLMATVELVGRVVALLLERTPLLGQVLGVLGPQVRELALELVAERLRGGGVPGGLLPPTLGLRRLPGGQLRLGPGARRVPLLGEGRPVGLQGLELDIQRRENLLDLRVVRGLGSDRRVVGSQSQSHLKKKCWG